MTDKLMVAFIAAAVVPPVVAVLSSGRRAGRRKHGYNLVEYSLLYVTSLAICCSFFTTLAVLAWALPGKTDPAILPVVIAVFLSFAGLSLLALVLARRSVVLWNDQELEGADMCAQRHRFAWDHLSRIEYVEAATSLRLWSRDGHRVWVSPMMRGFQDFHGELCRQASSRGLGMPEIPDVSSGPRPEPGTR